VSGEGIAGTEEIAAIKAFCVTPLDLLRPVSENLAQCLHPISVVLQKPNTRKK
jgi:hypothetical protein